MTDTLPGIPVAEPEDFRKLAEWIASLGEPGAKFDPNQPRDEFGRWTEAGAISVGFRLDPSKKFPEPRELPAFDLSPEAQDEIYTLAERDGITHAALADEIAARIGGPRAPIMEEALAWYPEAHDTAATIASSSNGRVDQQHAQAIIAALSPQMEWDTNVDLAQKIVRFVADGNADGLSDTEATLNFIDDPSHPNYFQTEANMEKAIAIARGGDIDTNLTGLKVRSFYNNIDRPNKTRDVTIDTHMVKAFAAVSPGLLKGGGKEQGGSGVGTALGLLNKHAVDPAYGGAGYVVLSEAVRAVSTAWGVPPDQIQAAYWLSVRDIPYDQITGAADDGQG